MAKRTMTAVCVLMVLAVWVPPLRGDAKADFQQVFGEQLRKAAATADTRDDAELAQSLLQAANDTQSNPELQILLCEKAYELGLKTPSGYGTAIEAMQLLAKVAPARRAWCLEKVLSASQTAFTRATGPAKEKAGEDLLAVLVEMGDARSEARKSAEAAALFQRAMGVATTIHSEQMIEVQGKLREAQVRQRIDQKFENLKARLAKDPKDAETRNQLVMMEVVEYEDLPAAVKRLQQDMDETLRTYVPLAAKPLDQTPEATCLELGEWSRKLMPEASLQGRLNILNKARSYYDRFVELHKTGDAALLLARKGQDDLEDEIDAVEEKLCDADGGMALFLKDIRVLSEGRSAGNRMAIAWRGQILAKATEGDDKIGLTMATFHGGKPLEVTSFNTHREDEQAAKFAQAVDALPFRTFVVLAVRWDGSAHFSQEAQEAIRSLGGKIGLYRQPEHSSYFCIGRKGLAGGAAAERIASVSLCYPPGSVDPLKTPKTDQDQVSRNTGPRWTPPVGRPSVPPIPSIPHRGGGGGGGSRGGSRGGHKG